MTATANGWRVLKRSECRVIDVPGGQLPVHPALAVVFADLATHYNATVEPLSWPGCWGWADRPIAGTSTPSNHASGTAVDLCAPAHPQGVAVARTFTPDQVAAIRALLGRYGGLIAWGGDWRLPSTDGMHWELREGATPAEVGALEAQLLDGPPKPPPPPPASGWTGPDLRGSGLGLRGSEGNNGPRVAALQAFWRDRFPLYAKDLAVDGWWGPRTSAVCREFCRRSGVRSDGRDLGPQTARRLQLAGCRV